MMLQRRPPNLLKPHNNAPAFMIRRRRLLSKQESPPHLKVPRPPLHLRPPLMPTGKWWITTDNPYLSLILILIPIPTHTVTILTPTTVIRRT